VPEVYESELEQFRKELQEFKEEQKPETVNEIQKATEHLKSQKNIVSL
jgi:hypothetical protein